MSHVKYMMFKAQKIGQIGEKYAQNFLQQKGFIIKDVNYTRPWGEIDIVAQKGNDFRFVEVKTTMIKNEVPRENNSEWWIEDRIDEAKLKKLIKITESYLWDKDLEEEDWQLDSIAVYLNSKGQLLKVTWLENIY